MVTFDRTNLTLDTCREAEGVGRASNLPNASILCTP